MIGIPINREIPLARVPIWTVLVALAAGWGSGYLQAVWSARAAAAESALALVKEAEDEAFERGAALAIVSGVEQCELQKRQLAEDIVERFACYPR